MNYQCRGVSGDRRSDRRAKSLSETATSKGAYLAANLIGLFDSYNNQCVTASRLRRTVPLYSVGWSAPLCCFCAARTVGGPINLSFGFLQVMQRISHCFAGTASLEATQWSGLVVWNQMSPLRRTAEDYAALGNF